MEDPSASGVFSVRFPGAGVTSWGLGPKAKGGEKDGGVSPMKRLGET